MELKTNIQAEENRHDIIITREFDIPVELLFKAHVDKEIFEEWMTHDYGTVTAQIFDIKKNGSFQFQTSNAGNVVFTVNGVIHDVIPNQKIIRTFEMSNAPFGIQLDFIEFEKRGSDKSKLTMHSVYRSVELRNQLLKLPF